MDIPLENVQMALPRSYSDAAREPATMEIININVEIIDVQSQIFDVSATLALKEAT